MARFSIEDTLFELPAFKALEQKLGINGAIGCWVTCGRLAQRFWKQKKLIPGEEVKFVKDYEFLIEFGFLQAKEDGYYFRGSEENFLWLTEKVEASSKGGRASAKARKAKFGSAQPQKPEASSNCTSSTSRHSRSAPNPPYKGNASLALESRSVNPEIISSSSITPFNKSSSSSSTTDDTALKIHQAFEKIFHGQVPNSATKLLKKITEHFGDFQKFKEWANGVMEAKAVREHLETGNWTGVRRYFMGALRNEVAA